MEEVYRQALYEIEGIVVSIGSTSPDLWDFMDKEQIPRGMVITPCNPMGRKIADMDNTILCEAFTAAYGHLPRAVGYSPDKTWVEEGFFMTVQNEEEAKILLKQHRQLAGVYCEGGKTPKLIWAIY